MKFGISVSQDLRVHTNVPPDGATALQLSRSQRNLEDVIQEALTDFCESVPTDAPPFSLSITASATGELETNGSSTSTAPPGDSLVTKLDQSVLSPSPSAASTPMDPRSQKSSPPRSSRYPTRRPGERHEFVGNLLRNCLECNMPLGSTQHLELDSNGAKVIGQERWDKDDWS